MDSRDKEIENLSNILSIIKNLYYKKKEQIDELQLEISELKNILNYLKLLVSNRSFHSADEIFSKKLDKDPMENYFKEEIPIEKAKGTRIKRKIFSKDDKDLLCVLNFIDFNKVEIKFIDPPQRSIKETFEDFINIFLKGALIKIKEHNPDLTLNYNYFKNSEIIESIEITNVNSIKNYDLITSKIRELLTNKISSNSKMKN